MRKLRNTMETVSIIIAFLTSIITIISAVLGNLIVNGIAANKLLNSINFIIVLGVIAMIGALIIIFLESSSLRKMLLRRKQNKSSTITINIDGKNITIKSSDLKDIENIIESLQKSHFTLEDTVTENKSIERSSTGISDKNKPDESSTE